MAELLNPLVGFVSLMVALEAVMLLRWRVRDDLPLVALLAVVAGSGAVSIFLAPDELVWPAITLVYGLLLQPLAFVLTLAATIARVRGAFRLARALHFPVLLIRPGHRPQVTQRVLAILARWKTGRLSREAAEEGLGRMLDRIRRLVRPRNRNYLTTSGLLLRSARVEVVARERDWSTLAGELTPDTINSIGTPCLPDAAWTVRALCETGQLNEAYTLLGFMTGGAELRSPAQLERFAALDRARVTFLAFAGQREAVEAALARGSQVRPVLTGAERTELLGIAARSAELELDTTPVEESLRRSARLPTAFSTFLSPAPLTLALVLSLVLVHLVVVVTGSAYDPVHLLRAGGLHRALVLDGEPWRLVSSLFLHAGALHLLLNGALLFALGNDAERLLGRVTFAFLYLASGIAGGIAAIMFKEQAVIVGASGAVFGVLGAVLVALWSIRRDAPRQWYRRRFTTYLFLALVNTALGWAVEFVSFEAHTGGFVVGALVAVVVVRLREPRPLVRRLGAWGCAALWAGLVGWSAVMAGLGAARFGPSDIPLRRVSFESRGVLARATWEIEVPTYWKEPWWDTSGDNGRPLLLGDAAYLDWGRASCGPPAPSMATPPEGAVAGFDLDERAVDQGRVVVVEAYRVWPDGDRLRLGFAFRPGAVDRNRELLARMLGTARVVSCDPSP